MLTIRLDYSTGAINQPSDQRTEQTVTDLVDKLQDGTSPPEPPSDTY